MKSKLHRLAVIAAIVAFAVIVLGAWVRLSHAGLGCPDWPGCYGKLTWPVEQHEVLQANESFPERPVEVDKAWREMVHRYLAGGLILLVLAINWVAWRRPEHRSDGTRLLSAVLLGLILFQAALGMWTVTLKLKPIIVMAHLLGGLTTFSLLLWLAWRSGDTVRADTRRTLVAYRGLVLAGLGVLALQLALGGWTSANYAALACPDFPTCQQQWWPQMDFDEAFVLWREVGVDYEGGLLDLPARTAIHFAHRAWAVVVLVVIGVLALGLLRQSETRAAGVVLVALLLGQVTLGILNVVLYLPLPNAVAHNGGGALLLAMMLWLAFNSRPRALSERP